MRLAGEQLLSSYAGFTSINGAAEATTLDPQSVDFITAGQAFHWFDRDASKAEFKRILRLDGWVVLVWNERMIDSTPFLREYESLLLQFGTDYQDIRHENTETEIPRFFEPSAFNVKSFDNLQRFDWEAFKGRVLSSSYVPEPDHPNFEPMLAKLKEIFNLHQCEGFVRFEYQTRMFYGQFTR